MRSLELLAPAKNLECGLAAIDHGADAVYIGASRFGARVAAGNSVDVIRQLCLYAHQFAAKVYVTVNTIIYDNELEATRQLLAELSDAGVDAILVQDMAVLSLLSDRSPLTSHLSFHASTQTDNRTVEKVRWLRDVGFRRVVLAREFSADEIAAIHEAVPDVELEVFVHGALCVSYSGLCYASEHCFGRSANRGACAQFCRMKFDLIDADGRELEHQRHLLSLKDMNLSSHLQELVDAGATSFKIEGRLKDAAYVKNVTAAYSEALNAIIRQHPDRYCRASRGQCTYTFRPDLYKTFNRGFTTYFLHGRQPDIFSPDTPKALGEYVGRVKELRRDSFNVAGTATFANGDGLCFFNADNELEGFRVNRAEGNRLFPQQMPTNLHPGVSLYRNNDQQFERLLSRPSSERRILIRLSLGVTSDGFSLSAEPVGTPAATPVEVTIVCEHQQAAKPQHDNIVRQLSKLGGTIYECSGVDLLDSFGYFIPNSTLTDLRRRLVEALNGDGSRCVMAMTQENRPQYVPPHFYDHPYLYNIANRLSCEFYGVDAPTAYELRGGDGPIMQCRHCLRYALGRCRKNPADRSTVEWREPLFLRLGDGRRFRLEFDCKHCQMNVYAED
jgi:putative protease